MLAAPQPTMDTYAGIILTGDEDEPCALAFIMEEAGTAVKTYSTTEDERIMELLEEHRPTVVALNAPQQRPKREDFQNPVEPQQSEEEQQDDTEDGDDRELDPATAQQFRSGEQELVEEGYNVLPQQMRDNQLLERAEFLSNSIKRAGLGTTIIESNADLVARRLNVTGDDGLEAYGLETDSINSVHEFDAVLLAYTAKLYVDDETVDKDLILPEETETDFK